MQLVYFSLTENSSYSLILFLAWLHVLVFISLSLYRASAIGVSAGQGIIWTQDGLVYVWELSTGNKLATLLCFNGTYIFFWNANLSG
ncbi:hypothetical protein IC582_016227 [Cucumis melo]